MLTLGSRSTKSSGFHGEGWGSNDEGTVRTDEALDRLYPYQGFRITLRAFTGLGLCGTC